jgi:hypothetical protein
MEREAHTLRNESKRSMVMGAVVVGLIIIGALYFWSEHRASDTDNTAASAEMDSSNQAAADASALTAISTLGLADDTASIQTDLNNTDTTNVDFALSAQ